MGITPGNRLVAGWGFKCWVDATSTIQLRQGTAENPSQDCSPGITVQQTKDCLNPFSRPLRDFSTCVSHTQDCRPGLHASYPCETVRNSRLMNQPFDRAAFTRGALGSWAKRRRSPSECFIPRFGDRRSPSLTLRLETRLIEVFASRAGQVLIAHDIPPSAAIVSPPLEHVSASTLNRTALRSAGFS